MKLLVPGILLASIAGAQPVEVASDRVFLDTSLVPAFASRLDQNGVRIPGGFRLGWWANLSTASALDGRLRVVTSLRADLDSSATVAEQAAFPGLEPQRFSLLMAYVEYDAARGLSVRGGRQFQADLADWLAFDGARVTWRLPGLPIQLEAYGGTRTTLAIPQGSVASAIYELDGVAATEGTQPVWGATLRWTGNLLKRRSASVGFRQSWRTGDADRALDASLPAGAFLTAEQLVAGGSTDLGPAHLAVGAAYEVVLGKLMRARASVTLEHARLFEGSDVDATYALEWQRYQPVFALDSIWNYFSTQPYDEAVAGATWRPAARVRLEARGHVRRFSAVTTDNSGNPLTISPGATLAEGLRIGAVWSAGALQADAWLGTQAGFGGRRVLADAGLTMPLDETVAVYGRTTLLNYAQDLQPVQSGNSLGLVAGVTWKLPGGASASLVLEEALNAFAPASPRLLGVVDFARWL